MRWLIKSHNLLKPITSYQPSYYQYLIKRYSQNQSISINETEKSSSSQLNAFGICSDVSSKPSKTPFDIEFLDKYETFLKRWQAFQLLSKQDLQQFSIFTFNHLLRGLTLNANKYQLETETLFQKLLRGNQFNCKPDINTFNLMIAFYTKLKLFKNVERIWNQLLNIKDIQPNLISFHFMFKAYSENENLNLLMIEKLYLKMIQEFKLLPNNITFTILLNACCKVKDLNKGLKFRDQMKMFDHIVPDIQFYNSLFQLYNVCDINVEIPYHFYLELKKQNIVFDTFTFGNLIEMFIKQHQPNKAHELFLAMLNQNIEPNLFILNQLNIDSIQAIDLLSQHQFKISPKFYNLLLNHSIQSKDFKTSLKIANHMKQNLLEPTIHAYTILMDAYLTLKQPDNCFALFEEIQAKNLIPDSFIYRALITASAQKGDLKLALSYLDQALNNGTLPSSNLFNSALEAAANLKDRKTVNQIFERMQTYGIAPDPISYHVLLQAQVQAYMDTRDRQEATAAWSIYRTMQQRKIQPSKRTLSMLLRLASAQGNIEHMEKLFKTMQGQLTTLPDATDIVIWMRMLYQRRQPGQALESFARFVSSKNAQLTPQLVDTFVTIAKEANRYRTAQAQLHFIRQAIISKRLPPIQLTKETFISYLSLLALNNQIDGLLDGIDSAKVFGVTLSKEDIIIFREELASDLSPELLEKFNMFLMNVDNIDK